MNLRRAQPSESLELREWLRERHYLVTLPPADRFALEFTEGRSRVGAMLLGLPPRGMDQVKWICLTRMFFVDGTRSCVESQGLAMMRRFVRVWVPRTRGLIAYSDPSVGHEGIVYEADGWAPFGLTKLDRLGHKSREGRTGETVSSRKRRWVRTP